LLGKNRTIKNLSNPDGFYVTGDYLLSEISDALLLKLVFTCIRLCLALQANNITLK